MRVNWCLRVVEMTLSKASDTVVWELNELLAADRRARAFSEASVAGELADRPLGFEASRWQKLGDESDEAEEASAEQQAQLEGAEDAADSEAEADADPEEAPIDMSPSANAGSMDSVTG